MNLRKLMCLSTILFFFSTVLAACSDNGDKKSDEPSGSLTLSTEILNFDSDGGSASVTVEPLASGMPLAMLHGSKYPSQEPSTARAELM